MNTLIFRTIVPVLAAIMLVFSVFILLRGHNQPGGGFIGGLIGASAVALYGIASGVDEVRKAMKIDPLSLAGVGLLMAGFAGVLSIGFQVPFLTGLWAKVDFAGSQIDLSTPLVFDIGVYLVVLGTISAIALALEEDEGDV